MPVGPGRGGTYGGRTAAAGQVSGNTAPSPSFGGYGPGQTGVGDVGDPAKMAAMAHRASRDRGDDGRRYGFNDAGADAIGDERDDIALAGDSGPYIRWVSVKRSAMRQVFSRQDCLMHTPRRGRRWRARTQDFGRGMPRASATGRGGVRVQAWRTIE